MMAAADRDRHRDGVGRRTRLSKNQRRMLAVLGRIPPAREQLIIAMEDISASFALEALVAAAESADARERNKVDVIERGTEKLINWMDELAARALSEGVRLGALPRGEGGPWERLAALGVITRTSAQRLRGAREARNDLAHDYPPASYAAIHAAAGTVLGELDGYVIRVSDWATENGILPPLS